MSKYIQKIELGENTACGKIIRWLAPGSTVLEFGPATGRMTKYMKKQLGCKVYIVEINPDDYKVARKYAEDGVNGDIQEFTWCRQFEGIKFDVVLFADVLEHLSNPCEVLQRVKDFLKDDGSVILSLPNVAHNDILIGLLNDEFHYTKTGLLDNTHLHFFAPRDLSGFFQRAGYDIVKEDYVLVPTFSTEQNLTVSDQAKRIYADFLRFREYGEVYQFLLEIKRNDRQGQSEQDEYSHTPIISNGRRMLANFFFETGSGFNEDEKRAMYIPVTDDGHFSICISLGENVKKLRFDPTENSYVLIQGFRAEYGHGEVKSSPKNAARIEEDYWLFLTNDPIIEIDVPSEAKWINISGKAAFTNEKIWMDFFSLVSPAKYVPNARFSAKCYFDLGQGFSEQNSVRMWPKQCPDGRSRYYCTLPDNVTRVRFDPVEGCGCFMSPVELEENSTPYSFITNGTPLTYGYLFTDPDPQALLVFEKPINEISIVTMIIPFI